MNYKKEIAIRSIKILDIGFITAIYLLLGIILAKICDTYLGEFDEEKENKKQLWFSILELILYLWFIGIVIYIIRNVVPLIPFPLDGIYGFDHSRVKELTSAITFSITFVYFQNYYQQKIKNIFSRITLL
jgi:hypothetical protein